MNEVRALEISGLDIGREARIEADGVFLSGTLKAVEHRAHGWNADGIPTRIEVHLTVGDPGRQEATLRVDGDDYVEVEAWD